MSENVWNYINPCFKMLNHPTNMYITVLYPQLEVINWFEMTCFIQAQICFHTHKCLNTQLPMSWFRVVHQYLGVNSAQLALTVFTPLPGISYSHLLEGVNLNIGLWGVKLPAVNITGQVWLNQLNACRFMRHVLVCHPWPGWLVHIFSQNRPKIKNLRKFYPNSKCYANLTWN